MNLLSMLSVSVLENRVPDNLPGATEKGVLWQVAGNRFLLHVPQVAKFLVEDGNRVAIEPFPGIGEDLISRFFNMTPLAVLMFQRGHLAFHAAAAAPPNIDRGSAVLIAGNSAAGKSTLLAGLQQRGWQILADELSIIVENDSGQPAVLPTVQEMLLWGDSLENLGLPGRPMEAQAAVHPEGRQVVDQPLASFDDVRPISTIIRLFVKSLGEIELKRTAGMRAFQAVGYLAYNSHIADAVISRQNYMQQAAAIAQQIPIFRLLRPRGQWSVEALADAVESEVIKRENG